MRCNFKTDLRLFALVCAVCRGVYDLILAAGHGHTREHHRARRCSRRFDDVRVYSI
jgi:hypothetical protein